MGVGANKGRHHRGVGNAKAEREKIMILKYVCWGKTFKYALLSPKCESAVSVFAFLQISVLFCGKE